MNASTCRLIPPLVSIALLTSFAIRAGAADTPKPASLPAPTDVAAPPSDAETTASGLASKALTAGTDRVKFHYAG